MSEYVQCVTSPEATDARSQSDRRSFSLRTLLIGATRGRRHHARREVSGPGFYVDRYDPRLMHVTLGILVLSCTDALLTLTLLSAGAVEVNPFMALLLEMDVRLFAGIKMALTACCLLIVVTHVHFRLFRVIRMVHVLYLFVPLYITLIGYEIALLVSRL